jgi:hypothetical protein
MVSCGANGTKSKIEKTIGDYLQTDKNGSKYDLKFKVIELNEHGTITVADSIAYLSDEFKKDKQLIVNRIELAKKMSEDILAKTKRQSDIEKYNVDIATMNFRIDSLKNLIPNNLNGYDSKNPDEILALIIQCKYSVFPTGGTTVEETFDFYLSPDGSRCYAKTRAK